MSARSVVVGVVAAGAMVIGGAGSASANVVWCMSDPPVQVQTPSGSNLTVGVGVSVPQYQAKYISSVDVQALTAPAVNGGTLITIFVAVPPSITAAHITASVKRYKVSTSATVPGGGFTILYLSVPTT